jgi:hypothetical protein
VCIFALVPEFLAIKNSGDAVSFLQTGAHDLRIQVGVRTMSRITHVTPAR